MSHKARGYSNLAIARVVYYNDVAAFRRAGPLRRLVHHTWHLLFIVQHHVPIVDARTVLNMTLGTVSALTSCTWWPVLDSSSALATLASCARRIYPPKKHHLSNVPGQATPATHGMRGARGPAA